MVRFECWNGFAKNMHVLRMTNTAFLTIKIEKCICHEQICFSWSGVYSECQLLDILPWLNQTDVCPVAEAETSAIDFPRNIKSTENIREDINYHSL